MIKILTSYLCIVFLLIGTATRAQNYRDTLHVANQIQYRQQVKQNPDKALVEIKKYIPNIQLDIRYATADNFMHQKMYGQARAFTRLPVAKALKAVQSELSAQGLGLKIYDGYRPYTITEKFYAKASDKHFVADPKKGSKHNRGCAIDLSLIDLKTGKELAMPTPFDSFSVKAAANYKELTEEVIQNRQLLKTVMESHGFKVLDNEWWHFDFTGWRNFEILDVPFEQL